MRTTLALLAIASLVLVPACGGGGGGGGSSKGNKPRIFRVRTIDPRNGAAGLPNDTLITIEVNDQVDAASLDLTTFFVTRDGDPTPHPGTHEISADRLRISFRPSPWFETATNYTVRVTEGLRASEGGPIGEPFKATFTTGPWPSPTPVRNGEFLVVPNPMNQGRSSHTSTLLGSGFVLIAGGYGSGTTLHATAEVFDPARMDFLSVKSMGTARGNHTATLLDTGLVLVVGGERTTDGKGQISAELFSPATLRFLTTAPMEFERTFHTATLLPDGRVLVTGGRSADASGATVWHRTGELYNPASGTWSRTANDMEMLRAGHDATLLRNGKVLITGGSGNRVAEIFDPDTLTFRTLSSRMVGARSLHGVVELESGVVFISDGGTQLGELFDPTTETFSATGNPGSEARSAAVTIGFRPGEVLILGGINFQVSFIHASMEQYDADYGAGGRYFHRPSDANHGVFLEDPRAFSAASPLGDGRFLITGGLGPSFDSPDLNTALLFSPASE